MHRNRSKQHSKAVASFGEWVVKGTKAVGVSLGEKRSDIWEEKKKQPSIYWEFFSHLNYLDFH